MTGFYWKPGVERTWWKWQPDSPSADEQIRRRGAMFRTWTTFSAQPGNGQGEPIRSGDMPIDVDCEAEPKRALDDIRTLTLINLPEIYGVDPYAISFWASGKKGFHATIPATLFGAEAGDRRLPLIYKAIVKAWIERYNLDTVDDSLYAMGMGKMFRLQNVRRRNGHYKVPLTLEEIRDLPIEDLIELTRKPRSVEPVEADSKPNAELSKLFTKQAFLSQNSTQPIKAPLTVDPVPLGQRNDKLTRLVGRWVGLGLDRETVECAALGWWYRLPDKTKFSANEVLAIVNSISNRDARKTTGEPRNAIKLSIKRVKGNHP